jgi:Mg-chelatase subunit ChlD
VIDPLGENDYFKVASPGSDRTVLTLELAGRPNIRSSLTLLTAAAQPLRQFDPGGRPADHVIFSWALDPAEYRVKMTEPPISVVLIWDASGSMGEENEKNLQQAVKTYLDQIRPDDLHSPSTYYLRPTLSRGPGRLRVVATGERIAAVSAPPQIELILDASGSMKYQHQKIDGRLKIDVAKDVMAQIIDNLPDGIQVALRVYGHRIREGRPGDCQDSELLVPFAKLDKPRLLQRARQIQALGTTPIAYSLQQVAKDFGATPGEKMVILVTDGKEERRGNPSAAVSDLLTQGMQVRLDIVGFALAEEAVKQEMERIAALTGGRFFDARDAAGLRSAIEQALAVPYEVHDAAGEKVGGGPTGQGAIAVPEGLYSVVVSAAGTPLTVPDVRVVHNELTRVELKKEGQEIGTQVVQAAPEEEAVAVAASSPTAAGVGNTPTAPGVSVAKVDTTPAAAKSSTAPEPAPAQQQTKCAKPSEPVPAQQAKRSEPAAHKKENVPLGLRKDVLFVGREEHGSE